MSQTYMNFTNQFPASPISPTFSLDYLTTIVVGNEILIMSFIFSIFFFYIVLLHNEIEELYLTIDSYSQDSNPSANEMLSSLKDLEKSLNTFHTRMNSMIKKVETTFNKEQEQLKSQMDEKEELYNNNIKTILQLSRNPTELQNYLESIGYNFEEEDQEDEDDEEEDEEDEEEDDEEEQPESDTEVVPRKRARREAAPVSFKKFFNDSEEYDSDESYVPPNKKL